MKIFLLAFGIWFLYRYLQAKYHIGQLKEKNLFYLLQVNQLIDEDPENPFHYCRRGSIHINMQNLIKARDDFRHALSLFDNGFNIVDKEKIVSQVLITIKYAEKPLPWSRKGPKDYSGSAMFYFLVDRFGGKRYNF